MLSYCKFLFTDFKCVHFCLYLQTICNLSVTQVFRNLVIFFRKRVRLVASSGQLWTHKGLFHLCKVQSPEAGNSFEAVIGVRSLLTSSHRIFIPDYFRTWKGSFQVEEEREFIFGEWLQWARSCVKYLIPTLTLWSWYHYPPFTDEEIKAQRA